MKKRCLAKANGCSSSSQAVRLEFTDPTAKSVSVAGTFNDWRPGATEMVPMGNGRWVKEMVLPPGSYEYRLVADGHWMADPLAAETVPNAFGGLNSILKVAQHAEAENAKARENSGKGRQKE